MQGDQVTRIYSTVSFDREGKIVEVRNQRNEVAREESYGQRKVGDDCPTGQSKIEAIKMVELEYITCADTKDPCWIHNPATCRWYKICP